MTDRTGLILFDGSHNAHWAEDVAEEAGIPAKLVPAPPEAEDPCGLAMQVTPEHIRDLQAELDREGVPHRLATPSSQES